MKRKKVWVSLPIVVVMVVAFAISLPANNAAVHVNDISCGMPDGDGGFVVTTGDAISVNSGNSKISCKADGVANSTGKAVIWNFENTGAYCGTAFGLTDKWQATISASGQGTLTCLAKP